MFIQESQVAPSHLGKSLSSLSPEEMEAKQRGRDAMEKEINIHRLKTFAFSQKPSLPRMFPCLCCPNRN